MDAKTIAVDLAKQVFEVAVETHGHVVSRHRLTRLQFQRWLRRESGAHVVMEACGTAHHWGRVARSAGHRVSLLPPHYVRPFVRRGKTDRTDVTGLLDAVRAGGLTPVPIKTLAQQEVLALHRLRQQWIRTRTARINALHGLLGEYGIVLRAGSRRIVTLASAVLADETSPIPGRLRRQLAGVVEEIQDLTRRIAQLEQELQALADDDPVVQRLQTIPGVGLLTATALVGSVGHMAGFRRARRFASWLGLTPRPHASGERSYLGAITKQGDRYLRALLTQGARAVLAAARRQTIAGQTLPRLQHWAVTVADRRGAHRAVIALANKLARIIWAVWTRELLFAPQPIAA